jgi:predicted transcriptional regulator
MDRLYHKGFLTRQLQGRTHLYAPVVEFSEVRDGAVKALIDRFFDGSSEMLRDFLDGNTRAGIRATALGSSNSFDEALL